LPTLAIRDRMIDEGSTVTRLLDKLEQAGLVTRDRSRPDRRQVLCRITPAGEQLLATLDPVMDVTDIATMSVLNDEALAQFIAAREIDRLSNPDLRVARNLAALFNPALFPGVGQVLRITQQELAYLVGLSRQRVNEALRTLEQHAVIRVEYGGLRVLDLPRLRSATFAA
jgi:DNA-binding MarR family transcriptional regulator